ncbi:MAG: metalloregulator ArsR/SmtB family transcription factor [Negativicutes bacterium]|nr:metalloregulator ArsR/SmtB family transcription factor [Negativicutes bacterium]MDR3590270.1 metalloregulator ArsR/SmtB family transcription factor [Negativicutes bacterium]
MKQLAEVFKALGDPVRLEIVKLLLGKELCVCDILEAFTVSQPTVSHHLKVLRYAGLVNDSREGKWIYYSLNQDAFALIEHFMGKMSAGIGQKDRTKNCE